MEKVAWRAAGMFGGNVGRLPIGWLPASSPRGRRQNAGSRGGTTWQNDVFCGTPLLPQRCARNIRRRLLPAVPPASAWRVKKPPSQPVLLCRAHAAQEVFSALLSRRCAVNVHHACARRPGAVPPAHAWIKAWYARVYWRADAYTFCWAATHSPLPRCSANSTRSAPSPAMPALPNPHQHLQCCHSVTAWDGFAWYAGYWTWARLATWHSQRLCSARCLPAGRRYPRRMKAVELL